MREVLTGYRSGSAVLALPDEPRPEYCTDVPLLQRYASKAQELGVGSRTIQRWVHLFQKFGEAGLVAQREPKRVGLASKVDERWAEIALEVMVEHTDQSRPSQTMVIDRTNARVVARFGEGVVKSAESRFRTPDPRANWRSNIRRSI